MARFINCDTNETADFEVDVAVGSDAATIDGAESPALFELLGTWGEPGGVGDATFDIVCSGLTLRGCAVAEVFGSRRLKIDFMERE